MVRRLTIAAVAVFLALPAGRVLADRSRRQAEQERVDAVLARFDRAQRQIRTLRARIVETRELAVLEKPEVLRGTLYFARPGRVRWEYESPERRVYVLADGELRGLIPSRRRAERLDVARRQDRIERMLALGQSSKDLRREFRIELVPGHPSDAADELRLVPRSRRVRRRVRELHLWISRKTGLIDRIRFTTGEGDVITLAIDDVEINPELSAALFRLEIPEGYQLAEGLSSFAGGDEGTTADGTTRR